MSNATHLVIMNETDTRSFERDANMKLRAVPGSGERVACECCGRGIVIHVAVQACEVEMTGEVAFVLRPIGERIVIGRECAKTYHARPRRLFRMVKA